MTAIHDWIIPDWPAPSNVKSLFTTRNGGVSSEINGVYASLNLGMHVNDNPADVERNRAILRRHLPNEPKWLKQVHGTRTVCIEQATAVTPEGDAVFSRQSASVCAVMVADCLPVYLCDQSGTTVSIVHAGWRGLAGGIIEAAVAALAVNSNQLMAWLGPAIGRDYFEVGEDVYHAFVNYNAEAAKAFVPVHGQTQKKWLADIFLLARQRLKGIGITEVYGGDFCTYSNPDRFYSYRRDGETGRMAALIWLE